MTIAGARVLSASPGFPASLRSLALALLVLVSWTSVAPAQARLANLFGDHMVLQRDRPVRVWGFAPARAAVQVRFGGQVVAGRADAEGRFEVTLAAMPANATGQSLVVEAEGGGATLRDVLVGDVWVCGGQSNMAWSLRGSRDADVEIPSANFPGIRFNRLPLVAHPEPQVDLPATRPGAKEGSWRLCVPEQVENCTAVGYYFARRLHRRLRVPIGLIDASWGGTMAQHWISDATCRKIPAMESYLADFAKRRAAWHAGGGEEGAKKRLAAAIAEWEKKRAAMKPGKRPPGKPSARNFQNPESGRQPSGMYNAMILPIAKSTIRGVLFYQGENNSFGESWKPFPRTFPAVVADWRAAFGDPELPFGLIQIAGWSTRRSMTYDMNHHTNIVREVQFRTWRSTPGTGLIVTFDANTSGNIHPARKLPIGGRAARWALAEVYRVDGKKPLEWHGPVYQSMAVEKDKIRIRFEPDSARGLRLDKSVDVGFYIAGADRKFHHARARVDGNKGLLVWCDEVENPVAVRYAWSNLPVGGLMNGRQLPAFPFRTDTWPLVPHQSKGAYEVGQDR